MQVSLHSYRDGDLSGSWYYLISYINTYYGCAYSAMVTKGLSPQTHLLWCFTLPLSWLQPGAMQHACVVGSQLHEELIGN